MDLEGLVGRHVDPVDRGDLALHPIPFAFGQQYALVGEGGVGDDADRGQLIGQDLVTGGTDPDEADKDDRGDGQKKDRQRNDQAVFQKLDQVGSRTRAPPAFAPGRGRRLDLVAFSGLAMEKGQWLPWKASAMGFGAFRAGMEGVVGVDDPLDEGMADDVGSRELMKTDALDIGQDPFHL